jgi:hypothetical protein
MVWHHAKTNGISLAVPLLEKLSCCPCILVRPDAHDLKALSQKFCPEIAIEVTGTQADTDDFFQAMLLDHCSLLLIVTLCSRPTIPEYPAAT